MSWLSLKGKNAFGVLSVLPCDSSLNINVGDFSLGFTLKKFIYYVTDIFPRNSPKDDL